MNGLPIRSLRQLACAGPSTARPVALSVWATATTATTARTATAAATCGAVRAASSTPSAPQLPQTSKVVPYKRYRQPRPELTQFREGHGEQIWIYNHIMTNQVVYSHTPVLRNNRALRQLPFNGKKTKPAKLRKDYWKPMALIQFDAGAGVAGQSVFQKLREFRRLHELSWGHQKQALYAMDRPARGEALNDQRSNSIADMAAALAGSGQGNRIWQGVSGGERATEPTLAQATIFWANEQDRNIAETWSSNVRHVAGIPSIELSGFVEVGEEEVEATPA